MQSELSSENGLPEGVHQKVFIDIAGEHLDKETSKDSERKTDSKWVEEEFVEKFDREGNLIPKAGTFAKCTNWVHEAYIKASNAEANDMFGSSVDIQGNRIVVGAYGEDSNQTTITNGPGASANNGLFASGAAYVFARVNNLWQQEAYIKPSNANQKDMFGTAGVYYDSNYTWQNSVPTPDLYYDNNDSWTGAMYVAGQGIAMSGERLVVVATGEDSGQMSITNNATSSSDNGKSNSGAVYVYKKNGSSWVQEAYLKPSNAGTTDSFGSAVAIDGDTIVVGARLEDSNTTTVWGNGSAPQDNNAQNSGGAYVFQFLNGQWTQTMFLKAKNSESEDQFGASISISGDLIAVGAPFEDSSQTTISNFPANIDVNNSAANRGAVYIFRKSGESIWWMTTYIKPSSTNTHLFGRAVSISGNRLAVGSKGGNSVHLFKRVNGYWHPDTVLQGQFWSTVWEGHGLKLAGNRLVIGAPHDNNENFGIFQGNTPYSGGSSGGGAGYVYSLNNGIWSQEAFIHPETPSTMASANYGITASLSGNRLVLGATYEGGSTTTITNGPLNINLNANGIYPRSGAVRVYACSNGILPEAQMVK